MKFFFSLLCALLFNLPSLAVAAQPFPDLDAVISYDTRITDRSGVTKTTHFQERFVRRADRIWAQRLLPAGVSTAPDPHAAMNALAQHEDMDYGSASRYLSLNDKGEMELSCIDAANTMQVHIPRNNWNLVGFADTWTSAASLIEPTGLAEMKKTARRSEVKGAVWYEQIQDGKFVRVLWSPALQVAMRIESGTDNGLEWRSTRLQPRPLTPASKLPWLLLDKLIQHDYEDFSD